LGFGFVRPRSPLLLPRFNQALERRVTGVAMRDSGQAKAKRVFIRFPGRFSELAKDAGLFEPRTKADGLRFSSQGLKIFPLFPGKLGLLFGQVKVEIAGFGRTVMIRRSMRFSDAKHAPDLNPFGCGITGLKHNLIDDRIDPDRITGVGFGNSEQQSRKR
jgi:hypothetical protein